MFGNKRLWLWVGAVVMVWGLTVWFYFNSRQAEVSAGAASIECGDGCLCGDPKLLLACNGPAFCNTHMGSEPWSEGKVYWENYEGQCSSYPSDWGTWEMVVAWCPGSCSAGGLESCGTYPQCGGSCSGGKVCKAIAATGSCNCGNPATCDEYVPAADLNATVRILPEKIPSSPYSVVSARFRWTAIDTTTYPNVERIALVVAVKGTTDFNVCKQAAINGNATAPNGYDCNVYQPNLAVTTSDFTATGALTAGTEYSVFLYFVTPDPPGALEPCDSSDEIETYLSSCELRPDPTTVGIGDPRWLTTTLVGDTKWRVDYTRAPTAYATLTGESVQSAPYRTKVTGVADGVVTVTGKVYPDYAATTLACSDNL